MRGLGRPRLEPWVSPWCSCTPLAAAELGQSLLDASRVAVDNLVQAEDSRTAGGRGRQRKPRGTLLWRTAEGNSIRSRIHKIVPFALLVKSLPTCPLPLKSRCFQALLRNCMCIYSRGESNREYMGIPLNCSPETSPPCGYCGA